ncbi:uncharacterized protein LOC101846605 isoform X2 [Aplysia californica]|uniref:Uncharacterized protein LOC101846605 isoform X2 n=1 Tax=Aplysia californica TaxID=6500 RepID=A0ABM1W0A5_APLCA|nr:uncharacterized protein LOC101846605 isoform X2 [Aplysia californica]
MESNIEDKTNIKSIRVDGVEYSVEDIRILRDRSSDSSDSVFPVVAVAVGCGGGLALILVCVLICVVCRKRRHESGGQETIKSLTAGVQIFTKDIFAYKHEKEYDDDPATCYVDIDSMRASRLSKGMTGCSNDYDISDSSKTTGCTAKDVRPGNHVDCEYLVPTSGPTDKLRSTDKEDRATDENPYQMVEEEMEYTNMNGKRAYEKECPCINRQL